MIFRQMCKAVAHLEINTHAFNKELFGGTLQPS